MKINDLISENTVNEDTWSDLGTLAGNTVKKGINRGLDKVGYHPETAKADKLDSRAKAIGLKMFTKQLTDLLTHAKSSGMLVNATKPDSSETDSSETDSSETDSSETDSPKTPATSTITSAPTSISTTPKSGQVVQFPGTNLNFTYTPRFVDDNNKLAPDAIAKVLTQLGNGVAKDSIPMSDLQRARQSIGLTESLVKHNRRNKALLESVCHSMTRDQKRIVEGITRELQPLIEVTLDQTKIDQIFQAAQQSATAAGGNRTTIGQVKDVASVVNDTINKAGKWIQDTKPVQSFDQKFEKIKNNVSQKFPELEKTLTGIGTWAKANPGKTAAVIGIMTALASLAGGPAGGAIAAQILRGTSELLKGEKVSTAVGKGAKSAAIGGALGAGISSLGDYFGNIKVVAEKIPGYTQLSRLNFIKRAVSIGGKNSGAFFGDLRGLEIPTQLAPKVYALLDQTSKYINAEDWAGANKYWNEVKAIVENPEVLHAVEKIAYNNQKLVDQAVADADNFKKVADKISSTLAAAAQGGVAAAHTGTSVKPTASVPTAESIDYDITNKMWSLNESIGRRRGGVHLTEAGVMNAIKQTAGKVGQYAQTKGQNLTTKITANKLKQAWVKAGSPTDSEEIEKVLQNNGVSSDITNSVFKSLNIPISGSSASETTPTSDEISSVEPSTSEPSTSTAAQVKVEPGQKIQFPGSTLSYTFNPVWLDSKNQAASKDAAKVLTQLASGVGKDAIPMGDLQRARRSIGLPESKQYRLFSTLLEYKMLEAEQITQTTEQFINQFLDTQTGQFKHYDTYSSNLKVLAQKASKEFDSTGKINPETMNKMWENLWMWSKMSGGGSHSNTQSRSSSRQTSGEKTNNTEKKISSDDFERELRKNVNLDISNYSSKSQMEKSIKSLITKLDGDLRSITIAREIPEDKISETFQSLMNKNPMDDYDKSVILKNLYNIAKTIGVT